MQRFVRVTVVIISSAIAGAVLTGSAWFLIAYAQHPATIGDRGFFTVGPGFDGLLGANIGLVQGMLLGTLVAVLGLAPKAGAMLGAVLSGGTVLILGTRLTSAAAVTVAILSIIISMVVGWCTACLLQRPKST